MTYSKTTLMTASLLALTACGGSNGGGGVVIGQEEEAARIFSTGNGDLGNVLQNGRLVTARQIAMAGINLNYDADTTELTEMTEFRVQENADGEFTLWLNGSRWDFVTADQSVEDDGRVFGYFNQDRCDNDGECVGLFNWNGELANLKSDGNGYHAVLNSQSNQVNGGQPDVRAFAILGTETRDDDLSSLGTATYNGFSQIDVYPETGFEGNSESRTRLRGDNLTMTADFGAGTIAGTIEDLSIRDAGEMDFAPIDGTLSMEQTTFTTNGFQGALTADAAFATSAEATLDASSTYSGAFYGPNAEEIGGVISASGTDSDGGNFNAIGMFTADNYDD